MPPSRREQLELDELLSDIYRGIEALPDKSVHYSSSPYNSSSTGPVASKSSSNLFGPRVHVTSVREYELPASSPLVKQHKQEVANTRAAASASNKQPQRSTLKRNTNTPDQQNAQSLASFVTSTTPENKRRVRILDNPEKLSKGYSEEDLASSAHNSKSSSSSNNKNVKYVNTNKLIYHQERNPDDLNYSHDENNNSSSIGNDDDDIDGVTHVKFYHTTWLDRQLGKASKRRSSKELNERQVKEKAMIEELKRSLKNGVITLRRPFKGKRSIKNRSNEILDDQLLTVGDSKKREQSSVFGSGLATIPRNYHQQNHSKSSADGKGKSVHNPARTPETSKQKISYPESNGITSTQNPLYQQQTTSDYTSPKMTTGILNSNNTSHKNYSSTLPQNYQAPNRQQHQLLQSHYSGADRSNYSTINRPIHTNDHRQPIHDSSAHTTRDILDCRQNGHHASETRHQYQQQQQQQQQLPQAQSHFGNTISGLPSATEVVKTALSRSSSQISLNQLNKTINYLPESPSSFRASPTTPTQYLKAASPSLSPSPVPIIGHNGEQRQATTNIPSYCTSPRPNSTQSTVPLHNRQKITHNLYGHRTDCKDTSQPIKQPLYANPQASLLQHRAEQQVRQTGRGNVDSIREFNELDSLLKSLSPNSNVHITPGYTSKPGPPTFGYGHQQPVNNRPKESTGSGNSQLYATVQKQPTSESFIVDATSNKSENCAKLEQLSEFEPRIDLLPSMEDYQNISKLNPVKNGYWYKPSMSRDRAVALLKDKPQGTFIVRDSSSFQGAFGLAVKVSKLPKNVQRNLNADPSTELIRHFLIEPTSNGVRLKGYANEPVFGSLPALIYQHSLTELALPCKLLIPRVDIENPSFNIKQKQFFDEFAASKELAKHQPYDRTSPNGGYRKYPGDVYVKNEHRIVFQ